MSIKDLITTPAAKKQIAAALPEHMTVDRQVRVALTALNKTPKLAQCTQGSFVEALMTCSELGLEPNGRHAHLVPYGDRCTLIVDYKGLITQRANTCRTHGGTLSIVARNVVR